ncbi:MAG: hypothetical protein ACFFEF_17995 [Candidatus Thorarchaeota archaeon]
MKNTPAEVLIPRILELRQKECAHISLSVEGTLLKYYDVFMNEIDQEVVPFRGNPILLEELWLTAVGYRFLSKLDVGLRTDLEGFRRIEKGLKKLNVEIELVGSSFPRTKNNGRVSAELRQVVISHALGFENP